MPHFSPLCYKAAATIFYRSSQPKGTVKWFNWAKGHGLIGQGLHRSLAGRPGAGAGLSRMVAFTARINFVPIQTTVPILTNENQQRRPEGRGAGHQEKGPSSQVGSQSLKRATRRAERGYGKFSSNSRERGTEANQPQTPHSSGLMINQGRK